MCPKARTTTLVVLQTIFLVLCSTGLSWGKTVITPSLTVSERYDSNPFLIEREQEEEDDFLTSVAPQLELSTRTKRHQLFGFYRLDSKFYYDHNELDNVSHAGSISLTSSVSRKTNLSLRDTMNYTQESLIASGAGIQTRRSDILSNTADAEFTHALSEVMSATLMLSQSRLDFKDPELVDSVTDSASLLVSYGLSENMTLSPSYGYVHFSFKNPMDESSIDSHSIKASLNWRYDPTLSFTVSGGLVLTPEIDNRVDASINLAASKQGTKTTYKLNYKHDVTNTSGLSDEINIQDALTASATYAASESFRVNGSVFLSRNRSEPLTQVDTVSSGVDLSLGWDIGKRWEFSAGYSFYQQWADGPLGDDIIRNQVFANIRVLPYDLRF